MTSRRTQRLLTTIRRALGIRSPGGEWYAPTHCARDGHDLPPHDTCGYATCRRCGHLDHTTERTDR